MSTPLGMWVGNRLKLVCFNLAYRGVLLCYREHLREAISRESTTRTRHASPPHTDPSCPIPQRNMRNLLLGSVFATIVLVVASSTTSSIFGSSCCLPAQRIETRTGHAAPHGSPIPRLCGQKHLKGVSRLTGGGSQPLVTPHTLGVEGRRPEIVVTIVTRVRRPTHPPTQHQHRNNNNGTFFVQAFLMPRVLWSGLWRDRASSHGRGINCGRPQEAGRAPVWRPIHAAEAVYGPPGPPAPSPPPVVGLHQECLSVPWLLTKNSPALDSQLSCLSSARRCAASDE